MPANKLFGLYGGAFDPVHNAHIEIAKKCIDEINLNKLILIPTGRSAFNKSLTISKHRLEMLNLVFKNPNYDISRIEIDNSEFDIFKSSSIKSTISLSFIDVYFLSEVIT